MRHFLTLALAVTALAACGEATSSPNAGAAVPQLQAVREAADVALRARLRGEGAPQQRGIQVFSQALPDQFAVCGRLRISGLGSDPFMPYVALVSLEAGAARVSQFSLGATGPEASRVFVLMVDRCFEGGGPTHARMTARSFPPMPVAGVAEAVDERPSASTTESPAEPASVITVITTSRSGANIRNSARGGDVVRTVPPASRLEVIGSAASDWVQVGANGMAWGWIHSSMLDAPAR